MNNELLKQLNKRPIAYYPIYRKITGSTTAGILLSQLMYWFSKKDKIYKTDTDIMSETLLTENELRTAKQKIKKLAFIKITLEGLPRKTFYEIDWDIYQTSIVDSTSASSVESTNTEVLNPQTSDSENHQAITETTAEIKTKTTSRERETPPPKKKSLLKESDYLFIYDYWGKYPKLIQPKALTIKIKAAIDKLTKEGLQMSEILGGINTYGTIVTGDQYFWSHRWSILEFLSRERGCRELCQKRPSDYLVSKPNNTKQFGAKQIPNDEIEEVLSCLLN